MSAPVATDRLLFRRGCDASIGQRVYGWTGPWPPPERMTIVTGPSGADAVCEPDHPTLAVVRIADGWRIEHFRLHHASQITEPARPDEYWFRGAEYVPVEVSS